MALHLCNPMTCQGFVNGMQVFGGCSMFWIAAVFLFFIIILAKRWIPEITGMPFSAIGAFGLGYLGLVLGGIFTCSQKFALLFGIIGTALGAYFGTFVDGGN